MNRFSTTPNPAFFLEAVQYSLIHCCGYFIQYSFNKSETQLFIFSSSQKKLLKLTNQRGFSGDSVDSVVKKKKKKSAYQCRRLMISQLGRFPGEGDGNPF